ncbi:MAG: Uma2 family endonuclease [Nostoc sp. GBBB01]|uniref:Uma2 family endonuclease n=1 Tax=Nostoc punctiforme FACHB-252 TaxID=1357509 RepID=A0ABR8H254_NOSPU|nr:Uma2 family endonuclease [Nostoc punctiforme]MBD2609768.1 Uma2 family endonuclease [Nostoc punctiforme FACHB-252]MBL1200421.1 Uma2 family endonuclease [Nostoc sp. GBBB01]
MEQSIALPPLPTAAELPDSDDTAVDNELQNLIPNLLLAILAAIWSDRQDWYFGVDMGIYYLPTAPRKSIVPDGFLSLGVERRRQPSGRLSYLLWEENWTPPILVVEVVSQTYGGEYDIKLSKYLDLGVLYYVIYNPDYWQRDNHAPFEVYQRVDDEFILQSQERFWIPELQLGIGVDLGTYKGWEREWLFWFDRAGSRFPSPDERIEQAQQQAQQAQKALEDLLHLLKQRGIDPDSL